jgi:serine/threonine-protein kinase
MAKDKMKRYSSAEEVEASLKELQTGISKEQAIQSLTIVFAGAQRGIGTTHAALGISNFLTRNGYPALYQEEYDTDAVRTLVRNMHVKADRTGVYRIGCTSIRPNYGRAVKLPCPFYPTVIKDTGIAWQGASALPDAEIYVLVCGGKWWETDNTRYAAEKLSSRGKLILLFNHMSGMDERKLPKNFFGHPCFYLPYFPDPFKEDTAADVCFRELLKTENGGPEKWEKAKRKKGLWRVKEE